MDIVGTKTNFSALGYFIDNGAQFWAMDKASIV